MKRPAIHNSFRVAFVCFGICCFAFAIAKLSHWVGYKRTQSVVELQHHNLKGWTNSVLEVNFMRPAGSRGWVPDLPAMANAGDHGTVLYQPDGGYGVIYSFDTVWRVPVYAASIGAVSVLLGIFFRQRPGGLLRVSHENAV